jgi:hypothetical protein
MQRIDSSRVSTLVTPLCAQREEGFLFFYFFYPLYPQDRGLSSVAYTG